MNPNEETQEEKSSALAVMAHRLNVEPQKLLTTLKNTVFKGANDSELLMLVVVANEYGLSPLLKEIYAFPNRAGGIVPVVSIDGWISMVNRQPQLDGLEFEWVGGEIPESCTCTIYIKNRSHPVRVSEFYKECFRNTEPWKMMPRRMLRHKALKEAARVAFGFSGVTDEDEARDITGGFPPPKVVKGLIRTEQPDFAPPATPPMEEPPKKAKARELPSASKVEPGASNAVAKALAAAELWDESEKEIGPAEPEKKQGK